MEKYFEMTLKVMSSDMQESNVENCKHLKRRLLESMNIRSQLESAQCFVEEKNRETFKIKSNAFIRNAEASSFKLKLGKQCFHVILCTNPHRQSGVQVIV